MWFNLHACIRLLSVIKESFILVDHYSTINSRWNLKLRSRESYSENLEGWEKFLCNRSLGNSRELESDVWKAILKRLCPSTSRRHCFTRRYCKPPCPHMNFWFTLQTECTEEARVWRQADTHPPLKRAFRPKNHKNHPCPAEIRHA